MYSLTTLTLLGAIAIIYGGGQIPSANYVIAMFAEKLMEFGYEVYGVHKSFLGMIDSSQYEKLSKDKLEEIRKMVGTFIETCRKVDPASNPYFGKIIENLKALNIHTLVIPGGDGSSRAASDLVRRAKEIGYALKVIFVPCTIDGIPGSETIGFAPAVLESYKHVTAMIANAFATWNPNYDFPRIAVIEIQGRNRNDIAAAVLRKIIEAGRIGQFLLDDIKLVFIPAGYTWSIDQLYDLVDNSNKKIAIIAAEGAKPIERCWKLLMGKSVGEKIKNIVTMDDLWECNLDVVGYLSQTNYSVSENEIKLIDEWVDFVTRNAFEDEESNAFIKNGDVFSKMSIHTFAKGTNSTKAIALTDEQLREFKDYLL